MALWGNNDNVGSDGTVSLDYDTLVVTGSGTTFGNVGAAKTGDVIRFGASFGINIGDAVIVGIASTTQISIASTAGLSGAAISGVQFQISESPKYAVLDSHLNQSDGANTETITVLVSAATTNAGIGTNIVFVNSLTGIPYRKVIGVLLKLKLERTRRKTTPRFQIHQLMLVEAMRPRN